MLVTHAPYERRSQIIIFRKPLGLLFLKFKKVLAYKFDEEFLCYKNKKISLDCKKILIFIFSRKKLTTCQVLRTIFHVNLCITKGIPTCNRRV